MARKKKKKKLGQRLIKPITPITNTGGIQDSTVKNTTNETRATILDWLRTGPFVLLTAICTATGFKKAAIWCAFAGLVVLSITVVEKLSPKHPKKTLWTICGVVLVMSLIVCIYFTLPAKQPEVSIEARRMPSEDYSPGTKVGGLTIEPGDSDTRLFLTVGELEIRNLRLTIRFDRGIHQTLITGMEQLSSLPGVSWDLSENVPPLAIEFVEQGSTNSRRHYFDGATTSNLFPESYPFNDTGVVQCSLLSPKSVLKMVFRSMGLPKYTNSRDKIAIKPRMIEIWGDYEAFEGDKRTKFPIGYTNYFAAQSFTQ